MGGYSPPYFLPGEAYVRFRTVVPLSLMMVTAMGAARFILRGSRRSSMDFLEGVHILSRSPYIFGNIPFPPHPYIQYNMIFPHGNQCIH
jgi:hypothetical protein